LCCKVYKMVAGNRFHSLVLLTALLLLLCPSLPAWGAAGASPKAEAEAFATALRAAAGQVDQTEAVIRQILQRFGLPVYEVEAIPLEEGALYGKPHGLFDLEVHLVAQAFVRGDLLRLDDLVTRWSESGIIQSTDAGETLTGAMVEEALRRLRLEAELRPQDPSGLLIRLVDELGIRAQKPFSLLGSPNYACLRELTGDILFGVASGGGTPGTAGMSAVPGISGIPSIPDIPGMSGGWAGAAGDPAMSPGIAGSPPLMDYLSDYYTELLAEEISEAYAEGDTETADFMMQMLAGNSFPEIFAGLSGGGTPSFSNPAIKELMDMAGVEVPADIDITAGTTGITGMTGMSVTPPMDAVLQAMESQRAAASEAPPEVQAYLQQTEQLMQHIISPSRQDSAVDQGLRAVELMAEQKKAQVQMMQELYDKQIAADKQMLRLNNAPPSDWVKHDANVIMAEAEIEKLTAEYEDFAYDVELQKLLRANGAPEGGEGLVGGLYIVQEEPKTSCLYLDPVQALLITLDLIGLPQAGSEGGVSAW